LEYTKADGTLRREQASIGDNPWKVLDVMGKNISYLGGVPTVGRLQENRPVVLGSKTGVRELGDSFEEILTRSG